MGYASARYAPAMPPEEGLVGLANRRAGATFCCNGLGTLLSGDSMANGASRLWGSAPPEEFSFPPDEGSCGLSIDMTDGGVCPPPSKAVHPWR